MLGYHPPPPADTPQSRHPQSRHPPGSRHPPWCRACWEIRSTRGRYASYWNANLFMCRFKLIENKHQNVRLCEFSVLSLVVNKPNKAFTGWPRHRDQGKQGIWFLLFPDRENTGNFALTQGKILRHRENIFL